MIFLVYLAVVICMMAMFKVSRAYKIAIIILTEMVFLLVKVPYIPYGMANYVVPLAFIASEIPHLGKLLASAKGKIVWKLLILVLFSTLIAFIFSPHLHDLTAFRGYFRSNILFSYFLLIYSYWCYSGENSLKPTLKITYYAMIFITIMGVINFITMKAGWIELVAGNREMAGEKTAEELATRFMEEDRFRNQSVFPFAFDYGFCCIAILLLHIYAYSRKLESKKVFLLVLGCCLFGIFTCGCRTVLFSAIIGLICYFAMANTIGRILKITAIAIPLLIFSYEFIPYFNKQVDSMMTMFDEKETMGGSSIESRMLQYAAVGYYIQDDMMFGRGIGFYSIDLNGSAAASERVDGDLQGLEGVTSSYLLERGIVGLALYLLFWLWMFFYFRRKKNVAPKLVALGCSLITAYLVFAIMTGELNSLLFVLPLLGYVLKTLDVYNAHNKLRKQRRLRWTYQ